MWPPGFVKIRRGFARIDWMLIAAFALAIPLITLTPLLSGQLPGTNDAELHLHRLISAALNLHAGIIWPRWAPDLHLGFGYPIGNFYAPGWHVAGAFLVVAGVPAVTVELLAQAIGIVLYPIGGYLFGRQLAGRPGALFGAAILLYAPFRFYELFEQGNISQLIAMGLIAWVLWAIGRCATQPSRRNVAIGGLLLAALVVTHHPTAFAFLPFAAAYALLVGCAAAPHRYRIIAPLAAFFLGVIISAIYWLPALTELKDVRVTQAASGLYDVQSNFVPLSELLGSNQALDRAALNAPRPFNAGQAGLILAGIGLIAALLRRSRLSRWQRAHAIGGAIVIAGCVYLMTDRSLWLWQLVPPAQAIQFPWRLMGVLTAATIPGAAITIDLIARQWQKSALIAGLLIVIILALPAMPPIKANVSEPPVITPGTSVRYEMATGNLGAVATYEYTPRWSTQRPLFDPCPECYDQWGWFVRVNQSNVPSDVQIASEPGDQAGSTRFKINAPVEFSLELHQFYFPGWQITLDGAAVPIHITNPYGLMTIDVPAGTHTVEAWYGGTPEQHIGDALAVIGLIVSIGLLIIRRKRANQLLTGFTQWPKSPQPPTPSPSGGRDIQPVRGMEVLRPEGEGFRMRAGLICVSPTLTKQLPDYRHLGIGISALAIGFATVVYPVSETFRANGTVLDPKPATLSIHKVFSDPNGTPLIELVGADLPDSVQPGQSITIRLYWHALQPLAAGWRVDLKLQDSLHTVDWANSDNEVPGGYSTAVWPLDQYVVDTHTFTVSADTPPYLDDLIVRIYNDAGIYLKTDSPVISATRVISSQCNTPNNISVQYGHQITLKGYTLDKSDGRAALDLYWRVDSPIAADEALFIHVMAGNTQVGNADTAPIAAYPSHDWQIGQCLHNRYTFDVPTNADHILIGFYGRADGQRLAARGNAPIENDGLVIKTNLAP